MESTTRSMQRILIGNGGLAIVAAGVIGFGFLFFLIGKIALWPIPWEIEYQMPGTYDAWRMAHMEAIANGLLLWLTAAILPYLPFEDFGRKRVAYAMIIVAWTIIIASCFDPLLPDSRGLEARLPVTNIMAFLIFLPGVALAMIVPGVIAYRCLVAPAAEHQAEAERIKTS